MITGFLFELSNSTFGNWFSIVYQSSREFHAIAIDWDSIVCYQDQFWNWISFVVNQRNDLAAIDRFSGMFLDIWPLNPFPLLNPFSPGNFVMGFIKLEPFLFGKDLHFDDARDY